MTLPNIAFAAFACTLAYSPLSAFAQGAPGSDAIAATDAEAKSLLEGKSWMWNAGGGSYWGKGGVFRAWAINNNEEIWAEGTWTATGGNVCYQAVWVSKTDKRDVKRCWQILKGAASNGEYKLVFWQKSDRGDQPGWIRRDKEFWKNFVSGDKISAKVAALKKS